MHRPTQRLSFKRFVIRDRWVERRAFVCSHLHTFNAAVQGYFPGFCTPYRASDVRVRATGALQRSAVPTNALWCRIPAVKQDRPIVNAAHHCTHAHDMQLHVQKRSMYKSVDLRPPSAARTDLSSIDQSQCVFQPTWPAFSSDPSLP